MDQVVKPSTLKRVEKEIRVIKEKQPNYEASIEWTYNDTKNKTISIQVITPKGNVLIFILPYDFPFKHPKSLTVNGNNYRLLLKEMPRRIQYLYDHPNDVYYKEDSKITHYKKPDCLCCSTLICPDNWSPVCTLSGIINEIKGHNQLKSQIGYKLVLKDIIDKFVLPVEIIRYLFVFL